MDSEDDAFYISFSEMLLQGDMTAGGAYSLTKNTQ